MELLIETFIYLIITMGLIIVVGSFLDVFKYNSIINNTYRKYIYYNMKNDNEKYIEVVIHINNYEKDEKEEIIEKIKKGQFDDLESVVDYLKIDETFDN